MGEWLLYAGMLEALMREGSVVREGADQVKVVCRSKGKE